MKWKALIYTLTFCQLSISTFGQTMDVSEPHEFVHGVFTLKVKDAYWKEVLYTKGIALEYQNESTTFYPSGKFLVVEVEIINNGDQPYRWKSVTPPIFRVSNSEGIEYVISGNHIAAGEDLGQTIIHPGPIINPKMSIKGKEIFDVPEGKFDLVVYRGKHTSGWNYSLGDELCRFILNPRILPTEENEGSKCPDLVKQVETLELMVDSLKMANSLLKEMLKN